MACRLCQNYCIFLWEWYWACVKLLGVVTGKAGCCYHFKTHVFIMAELTSELNELRKEYREGEAAKSVYMYITDCY